MYYVRIILKILCVTFFFFKSALCSEPIKIKHIRDAKLFETGDGRLISLSNVETFSIFDTDSLKKRMAKNVLRYAQQSLLNRSLILEFQYQADSIINVHLFEKVGLSRRSINQHYLKRGFGYYIGFSVMMTNK